MTSAIENANFDSASPLFGPTFFKTVLNALNSFSQSRTDHPAPLKWPTACEAIS